MILLMNMPGNRCLSSKDTRGHLYFDIVKNTKKHQNIHLLNTQCSCMNDNDVPQHQKV